MSDLAVSTGSTNHSQIKGKDEHCAHGTRETRVETPREQLESPSVSEADKVARGRSLPTGGLEKEFEGRAARHFLKGTEKPFKTCPRVAAGYRHSATQVHTGLCPGSCLPVSYLRPSPWRAGVLAEGPCTLGVQHNARHTGGSWL